MTVSNKIRITIASIITCSAMQSYALEDQIRLQGMLEVQSIFYKNNGSRDQRVVSLNNRHFGLYSSGNALIDYRLSVGDIDYGAKIGLELTVANNRNIPFVIHVERDGLGKVEVGSDKTAGQKMKITGYTVACAIGNGWNSKIKTSPGPGLVGYVTSFCSFLDAKMRSPYKIEYARKVSYYTPKLYLDPNNSFQLGISYVPDSSNMGYGSIDEDARHTPVAASKYAFVIKDGISYGITYKNQSSNDRQLSVAFVGERGKPIAFTKSTREKTDLKFKDLNTYVIGASVKQGAYEFAGSYGNYNRSLTSASVDLNGRDTHFAAFSARHNFTWGAASLSYFGSNHKKNIFRATSAGVDYNITSGVKSYLQATYYQAKGKYIDKSVQKSDRSSGILLLAGAKISI